MFKDCNTLAELNAKRIQATSEGVDLIEVNNAYNTRRCEILSTRKPFVVLKPIIVEPRTVQQYCGIPIVGRATEVGCISLTEKGFLY